MESKEYSSNNNEKLNSILLFVKESLHLLETQTRTSIFGKATNWLKNLLWLKTDNDKSNTASTTEIWTIDKAEIPTTNVDRSWFTPWPYPFKHITKPYKWIKAYRVDNVKIDPLIWFSQLSLSWTEWKLISLKVKDLKLNYSNKKAIWYKKNNPCNVTPYKWDIWRTWSSKVADWQDHGKYNSMICWLASFMKLMRKKEYINKSIQWINCSWLQWTYHENEPESLKALRIIRITNACRSLNISPFVRIKTEEKETMMAFTQQTAINETWSYIDRTTLEKAYSLSFN